MILGLNENIEFVIKQTVYLMDCIKGMQTHVEDGSVSLAFADPPFNINYDKASSMYGYGVTQKKDIFYSDSMTIDEYYAWCMAWMQLVYNKLKENGIFILMICWNHVDELVHIARNMGFHQINRLIWNYEFAVYTKRKYASSHYHYPIFLKGDPKKNQWTFNQILPEGDKYLTDVEKKIKMIDNNKKDRKKNVLTLAKMIEEIIYTKRKQYQVNDFLDDLRRLSKRYVGINHPCKLTEDMPKKLILEWTNEGDLVMDVFTGSGTTMISSHKTRRNYVGFEIDTIDPETKQKVYCWAILQMIKRRIFAEINENNADLFDYLKG